MVGEVVHLYPRKRIISPDPDASDVEDAAKSIAELAKNGGADGMVVALTRNGRVISQSTYGEARKDRNLSRAAVSRLAQCIEWAKDSITKGKMSCLVFLSASSAYYWLDVPAQALS